MATGGTLHVQKGAVSNSSMRYHEVALQRWLYSNFQVDTGYPVPVVFTSPMDAFSTFTELWQEEGGPFRYLLDAKDAEGTPLYQPHPAPIKYPLISVYRRGWSFRPSHNFSIHRFRHINWPTVSGDVDRCDLGNVTTSKMPMAWNFKWQIDHYCMNPGTQALYVESLMRAMSRTGGSLQDWMYVTYPGWGEQLIRVFVEGDIESGTPEQPEDGKAVEYRTTMSVVAEGYSVDSDIKIEPALWSLIFGNGTISLDRLDEACGLQLSTDLRAQGENPEMLTRDDVPDNDGCNDLVIEQAGTYTNILVLGGDSDIPLVPSFPLSPNDVNNPSSPVSLLNPNNLQDDPNLDNFSGGISSQELFGEHTVT